MPIIDSHVHVWRLGARPQPWINPLSMPSIWRDFSEDDLRQAVADSDIEQVVLVQVLNRDDETDEYLERAANSTLISAVVGWVDLASPSVGERLDALREQPGGDLLRGIRHQVQEEGDPSEWLRRESVSRGLSELARRQLVFEFMLWNEQLDASVPVVAAHQDVEFVVDHGGKPPVVAGWDSDAASSWRRAMRELASRPNVSVKLSGLTSVAHPNPRVHELQPFVDELLERFGARRVIFGSDWPVSLRSGAHRKTVETALELLSALRPDQVEAIMAQNARRMYRL